MAALTWRSAAARSRVRKRRVLRSASLAVDQQGEPVGVGEVAGAVLGLQLGEGLGHAVEPERAQLVEGRVGEHGVSPSVEVAGAADVGVGDRRPVRGRRGPSAIEVGLQDRVDRGVGARADLERAAAGGLEPVGAVGSGQPQDAEAGAEALLGMACARAGSRRPAPRCRGRSRRPAAEAAPASSRRSAGGSTACGRAPSCGGGSAGCADARRRAGRRGRSRPSSR